jgi:hypothetical protein
VSKPYFEEYGGPLGIVLLDRTFTIEFGAETVAGFKICHGKSK